MIRNYCWNVPKTGRWTELARSTDGRHVYIANYDLTMNRYRFVDAGEWDNR